MKGSITILLVFMACQANSIWRWLEHHLISCPFKQLTGVDCPGCGLQRSALALFKGEFLASFKFYPATMPLLLLIVFLGLHLKFDFVRGALFIKILYIAIATTVVINYIYKIITHQLI